MALTANKVLVSDNNGDIATSSTDSSKLTYIGSLTSNAEQTGNKVTSLSSANTDTQYPSAKAVYDEIVPNVSASYTAVSNKGGTLPATQNLSNLATAIGSIPSGYSELPSYQVSNSGVASGRSLTLTGHEFDGITSIAQWAMSYVFYGKYDIRGNLNLSSVTAVNAYGLESTFRSTGITTADLSSITTLTEGSMTYCFYGCSRLTTVDLSSLQTTTGEGALCYAFVECGNLTNLDFHALTTLRGYTFGHAFEFCTSLQRVDFPALTNLSYSEFWSSFSGCESLTDIYFNALTTTSFGSYTDQFQGMLSYTGTDTTHTLHFPSNLQTTISGLSGYPNFGGTSGYVTLAFDLPSTS